MSEFKLERGVVESVNTVTAGEYVASDVAAGQTVIPMADVATYVNSVNSGQVMVDGAVYTYTVNETSSTLTLGTALAQALVQGDQIDLYPTQEQKRAQVSMGTGDAIDARVPFHFYPLLADGIRDGDKRETVEMVRSGSDYVIWDVVWRPPVIDGSLIDPDSIIPAEALTDGVAPSTSPAALVSSFSIGGLQIAWNPITNPDPVTYKVYASLTSPVTTADELVATTTGTRTVIQWLDGQLLPLDGTTPVYAAVLATDADGPATSLGAEGSAIARLADAETISSMYAYLGAIEANQITAGTIDAVIGMSTDGAIKIGSRITIAPPDAPDDKGGIIIWGDDEQTIKLVWLHPDGNHFTGEITAEKITVVDSLRILGELSAIASGARVKLENGVASPQTAPTVTAGWERLNFTAPASGYTLVGVCDHPTAGYYSRLLWRPSTSRIYIQVVNMATDTEVSLNLLPSPPGYSENGASGIVYYSGHFFIGVMDHNKPTDKDDAVYIAKYDATTFAFVGQTLVHNYVGDADQDRSSTFARLGVDYVAGEIFFASSNGSAATIVASTLAASTASDATTPFTYAGTPTNPALFMGRGSYDYGSAMYLAQVSGYTYVLGSSTSKAVNNFSTVAFTTTPSFSTRIFWHATDQHFYMLNGIEFYRLAPFQVNATAWAQYADTAGALTTLVSPESAGVLVSARKYATVSLPPAPLGVTGASVFVGYGSTSPGTTKKKRTETLTGRSMTLRQGTVTGSTAFPAANTMGGSPGEIYDGFGNYWRGNGLAHIKNTYTPPWVIVPDSAFASGYTWNSFGYRLAYRVWPNGTVEWRGGIRKTSGDIVHNTVIMTVPAGALPTENGLPVSASLAGVVSSNSAMNATRLEVLADGGVKMWMNTSGSPWVVIDGEMYYRD